MGRGTVEVTNAMMEELFKDGHEVHYRVMQGLPAGARLIGVSMHYLTDSFTLAFEHPDWPEGSTTHIDVMATYLPCQDTLEE